jgi:transposase
MPRRLRREEVVTIEVLAQHGTANTLIASQLGVTEGAVRYHRNRAAEGLTDGRKKQAFKAAEHAPTIAAWVERLKAEGREVNVVDLYDHLVASHKYSGSRRNLARYLRSVYGPPRLRAYRRVETPPAVQTQTDWGEFPSVRVRGEDVALHAFVMVLSHSRKPAVVWSRREDEVSWLACHNGAFVRLGGVAAVNRIDNVKTAIATGAGSWGTIHDTYRAYARSLGFHVDACQPRTPNAKGKVEAKVHLTRLTADPSGREFGSLEEIQAWTDERLERWTKKAICPVTGTTVAEAWEAERPLLRPLPALVPEPFDVVVTRPVQRDCMVWFEGRQYAVPFEHVGRHVEVRGCASTVQILFEDRVVRAYPRGTAERVLIDPTCYEGASTDRVIAPTPLGKMGRKLQELVETPAPRRSIDYYVALSEVAR